MFLTEKQEKVFNYIKNYISKKKGSPSYEEIRQHFGFNSLATVFDYIRILKEKNFITTGLSNAKRNIELVRTSRRAVSIPLLGMVTAGPLTESLEVREYFDVPESILAGGENVALKVRGESMIESGIYDGDVVIVRRQQTAGSGEKAVVLVDGEVTLKSVYFQRDRIELRPSNAAMKSIYVKSKQDFQIYGVIVGLYRKF